jgi:hypothetical protein
MPFWSWLDCWNPRLIRFERSENCKLLSPVQVPSQKTSKIKLAINFLNFPFITHTLKYNKQRRSYDHWNIVPKWKNIGYNFWFGLTMISQSSTDRKWYRIRKNAQYEKWQIILKPFQRVFTLPYMINGPRVMIIGSRGVLLKIPVFRTD